ncbi:MAG: thioredoxin family protein [Planctomycetota bacterium]|nr:MAG: thioredoxin family protein [Planctomycetota bacterium]
MVMTASTMLPLGTAVPAFSLPDSEGNIVSVGDFKDMPALLVIFMCNHCPFVRHILSHLVELIKQYQQRGLVAVAINSNDVANFPEDSPKMMARVANNNGFTFPYLYDETQDIAKKYHAACTPDFFLFDRQRKLVYRGQLDDSRPTNDIQVTGSDLRAALDAVLEERKVPKEQKPSIGCNIKWKQGNEPEYVK